MHLILREAAGTDRQEIVDLYTVSQQATGKPDPATYPPERLGELLYARPIVEQWVGVSEGRVIGHGLIEHLTREDEVLWERVLGADVMGRSLALGGAFTDPGYLRQGVYTALLVRRLERVRRMGCVPLSATWGDNHHVARLFERFGGSEVGASALGSLPVRLFVFNQ